MLLSDRYILGYFVASTARARTRARARQSPRRCTGSPLERVQIYLPARPPVFTHEYINEHLPLRVQAFF